MSSAVRKEQDIAFYKGLEGDIRRDRKLERERITQELQKVFPRTPEDTLPASDARLLRLNPRFLTPEEKAKVEAIKKHLEALRNGGCYGEYDNPDAFRIRLHGLPFTFCFSIEKLLESGLVNSETMMADVKIKNPKTGEIYVYPLSNEEVEDLLGQAYTLGYDLDRYPSLKFPHLEEARKDYNKAMYG